ncbi:pncA [Mytilus coruscus]|uniref:nicotinamidase n=1 Tax=Mytilus coruscus TaxID=42192 RepID=A0A6J7ZVY9_MYTCO|nr:pncA [Mytilus coruscus]
MWPDNCVINTPSANFSFNLTQKSSDIVIRKDVIVDSYSAFYDNGGFRHTELNDKLQKAGIDALIITGLARDYCVYYTAMDATKLAKELDKSGDIIAQGIQDESVSTQLRQVLSAERRLKDFAAKLEDSIKEISLILEEKEDNEDTNARTDITVSTVTTTRITEEKSIFNTNSAISGLTLSHENYDVAISILKERYGNVQFVVNKHYSDLINLQSASNQTSYLHTLYDDLERHLSSLDAMHQDVTQDEFISMITSKLPKEVLIQLEIQKGNNERWTVGREAAESQSKETHTGPSSEEKTESKIQSHSSNFQPRKHLSA